jgi:hypothetical protein
MVFSYVRACGDRGIQAAGASYAIVAFLLLYVFN